jgi:hypothetical protein
LWLAKIHLLTCKAGSMQSATLHPTIPSTAWKSVENSNQFDLPTLHQSIGTVSSVPPVDNFGDISDTEMFRPEDLTPTDSSNLNRSDFSGCPIYDEYGVITDWEPDLSTHSFKETDTSATYTGQEKETTFNESCPSDQFDTNSLEKSTLLIPRRYTACDDRNVHLHHYYEAGVSQVRQKFDVYNAPVEKAEDTDKMGESENERRFEEGNIVAATSLHELQDGTQASSFLPDVERQSARMLRFTQQSMYLQKDQLASRDDREDCYEDEFDDFDEMDFNFNTSQNKDGQTDEPMSEELPAENGNETVSQGYSAELQALVMYYGSCVEFQ